MMLELLNGLDVAIFYFINDDMKNIFLDWVMPILTEKKNWFPLFGILYVMLLWKGGKKGRTAALLIIAVILLSDQLSSSFFKPMFQRLRPCVALENVNMLIGLKTSYSFPSSHATNSFATAVFFSYYYPAGKWTYLIFAVLIAFSRVYVGVHYPFDVLIGAALGSICALVIIYVYGYAVFFYEHVWRKSISSELSVNDDH